MCLISYKLYRKKKKQTLFTAAAGVVAVVKTVVIIIHFKERKNPHADSVLLSPCTLIYTTGLCFLLS